MTLTLATMLAEERVYWGGSCLQKLPCVTRGRVGLLGGLHPPILGTPTSAPLPWHGCQDHWRSAAFSRLVVFGVLLGFLSLTFSSLRWE